MMEPLAFGLVTLGVINYFARDMMYRGGEWAIKSGVEFFKGLAMRTRETFVSRGSVERV